MEGFWPCDKCRTRAVIPAKGLTASMPENFFHPPAPFYKLQAGAKPTELLFFSRWG